MSRGCGLNSERKIANRQENPKIQQPLVNFFVLSIVDVDQEHLRGRGNFAVLHSERATVRSEKNVNKTIMQKIKTEKGKQMKSGVPPLANPGQGSMPCFDGGTATATES